MPCSAIFTFQDHSAETSSVTVFLPALAMDGTNWPAIVADLNAVFLAMDGVTLGNIQEYTVVAERARQTNVIPPDGEREMKLKVAYQDDVTLKRHTMTIPCRDNSKFTWVAGSEFVDLSSTVHAEQVALLTALTNNALSPEGNSITVISMERVGRNL